MKKILRPLFSSLALLFSVAMLFFTFFTLGWFSDVRGWEWGVELQINFAEGGLRTVSDLFWTAAPFFLLISVFLRLASGKTGPAIAIFSSLPLALNALGTVLLYFSGERIPLPTWVTVFFLLIVCIFTVAAAFLPELQRFSVIFPALHLIAEIALFLLSLVLQEKLSQFYFSELLPMGHTSYFRYTFVLWSILFYYLSYEGALLFSALSEKSHAPTSAPEEEPETKESEASPPSPEEPEESPSPDGESDSDDLDSLPQGISLEDLGIER